MSPTPCSAPLDVLLVAEGTWSSLRAATACANAYVTKPLNPVELLGAMTPIEQFWVEILKLP